MHFAKLTAVVLAAATFLFVGCEPKTPKFPAKTQVVELTVVTYHHKDAIMRALEGRIGMAVWSPNDNKCEVHFVAGDMVTAGHELHHCLYGSFHEE